MKMEQKTIHAYIYRDLKELKYEFRDKATNRLVQFIDPVTRQVVMSKEIKLAIQRMLQMAKALENYGFFNRDDQIDYFTMTGNVFFEDEQEINFAVDSDLKISNTPFQDRSAQPKSPTWHSFHCYLEVQPDGRHILLDKATKRRIVLSGATTQQIQHLETFLSHLDDAELRPGAYQDPNEQNEYIVVEGTVVDETATDLYVKFGPDLRYYLA